MCGQGVVWVEGLSTKGWSVLRGCQPKGGLCWEKEYGLNNVWSGDVHWWEVHWYWSVKVRDEIVCQQMVVCYKALFYLFYYFFIGVGLYYHDYFSDDVFSCFSWVISCTGTWRLVWSNWLGVFPQNIDKGACCDVLTKWFVDGTLNSTHHLQQGSCP